MRDIPLQPADLDQQPPDREDAVEAIGHQLRDGRLTLYHPDRPSTHPELDEWLLADPDDWTHLDDER
jgi:hypothetical protein